MSSDTYQPVNTSGGPSESRPRYDVFLSYTHEDQALVREVADALRRARLSVWFDEWMLQPGMKWQLELENGIRQSRAVAVFLGPSDMGLWVYPEMAMAFDRAVNNQGLVIPVLLPGVSESDDRIPLLLRTMQFCPMGDGVNQESLDSLIWGITGRNPLTLRTEEHRSTLATRDESDPATAAAEKVAQHLMTGNVTFFFGRNATPPKSDSDITSTLLEELGLIGSDWDKDKLLPPVVLAASYFAVKHGVDNLEYQVLDILSRLAGVTPACYAALASLQVPLAGRGKIRGKKEYKRLIVSSNLDILLEKALLVRGAAFTRIVQYRSSNKAQINTITSITKAKDGQLQVHGPDGRFDACNPDDDAALGSMIANCGTKNVVVSLGNMIEERTGNFVSIDSMVEPIIYKLHGSQDVETSCTLSTEQYFDILWRSMEQKCIPDALTTIISNTPLVFFGSCIVDADFLLTYALLRVSLEAGKDKFRYAVVPRSAGDNRDGSYKLTCGAWEELRVAALKNYGIEMLDQHGELFFKQLTEAFDARR